MSLSRFDVASLGTSIPQINLGTGHAGDINELPIQYSYPQLFTMLFASSTDTIDHELVLLLQDSPVASVVVPAGAGFGALPLVDILGKLAALTGFEGLYLPAGTQWGVSVTEDVTSGQHVHVNGTVFYFRNTGVLG